MAECFNIACPYCADFSCKRTATCDMRLDGEYVKVVRCKDCKHQEKYWHEDRRMKNGGYYITGCDLADGYSHVCLDDDYCSKGERKDGGENG